MPDIRNPIQRYFWDNLTQGGLDLVNADRVDQLVDYVKQNKVDTDGATPAADGEAKEIDSFEKNALRNILENDSWRSLLTDDGVRKLEQVLGVATTTTRAGTGRDATGEVPKGSIPGNLTSYLGRLQDGNLASQASGLFNYDYEAKKDSLFENPSLTEAQRAENTLHLLRDYSNQLNEIGHGPELAKARKSLLETFFTKPNAKSLGAADPDDDFLSTAWEIVYGTDPEKPQSSFDIDKDKKWSAYMAMNGGFIPTAEKVDKYLADAGQPANAAAFEKKSPLNWIVGEQAGNTKPSSSFREEAAISSTGVDFAKKLLDDEGAIGDRTIDPSFDMKVDFYAWDNFVPLRKAGGDTLVPKHDDTGEELKVEIEEVGDTHWKPIFKDSGGNAVDPSKVTSVVKGADGEVKGDGKATGAYSASWWGFCDRNAMQGLVTLKYGFPKPQKDVTLKAGDKEHTFTASEVTDMVGRRLTEVFPKHTQAGNRFDEEPDQIFLKSGGTLAGKIQDDVKFYRPETYRHGDSMVLPGTGEGAPRGSLLIKGDDGNDVDIGMSRIAEVRRAQQGAIGAVTNAPTKDTVVLTDGTEVTGTLSSKVNFGAAERQPDGTMVLKNTDDSPLYGDLRFKTTRGEDKRVALNDINMMVREDDNEILGEEALAYIVRNKGVFSADSWKHSSVANGTRTIEEINRWAAGDADKPDWIPDDVASLKGYRGEVKNPDNVYFFSMGNKGSSYGGIKFWMEVDDNRTPINSNITDGQWDFLWGVEGKPKWDSPATFNPHVPNDLVLRLYINSLEDPEAHADVLPDNWRDYLNQD